MSCCACEPSFEVKTSHSKDTGQTVTTDHPHKDTDLSLRNDKSNYNSLKIKKQDNNYFNTFVKSILRWCTPNFMQIGHAFRF